jgi:exoribonuclease R
LTKNVRKGKLKQWKVEASDGETHNVPIALLTYVASTTSGWSKIDVPRGPILESLEHVASTARDPTHCLAELLWRSLWDEVEPDSQRPSAKSLVQIADILPGLSNILMVDAVEMYGHNTTARLAAHAVMTSDLGLAYFEPVEGPFYRARSKVDAFQVLHEQAKSREAAKKWKAVAVEISRRATSADATAGSLQIDEDLVDSAISDLKAFAVHYDPSTEFSGVVNSPLNPRCDLMGGFSTLLGQNSLKSWPRTPSGAYSLLVALGVWSKHVNLYLLRSDLPHARPFPAAVLDEAKTIWSEQPLDPFVDVRLQQQAPTAEEALDDINHDDLVGVREDLTHLTSYSVDSSDTFEVDDAVGAERLQNNRTRIWVHIADVSRWVASPSTLLAKEAMARQTTLYLPTGTIPMFPAEMAAEAMSLAPLRSGESIPTGDAPSLRPPAGLQRQGERPALSLGIEIEDSGKLVSSSLKLCASTIKLPMRLSYEEVNEMLEYGCCSPSDHDWALGYLAKAAASRRCWRSAKGCVETNPPYVSIKASEEVGDGDGKVSLTPRLSDTVSEVLISEMMILAGEAVGLFGRRHRLPLPYRNQPAPAPEQLPNDLHEILDDLGGRFEDAMVSDNAANRGRGHPWCRAAYMRKFMKRVLVSSAPRAHWSLGVEHYVQWTSPLRRHSDLVVHWQLKAWLLQEQQHAQQQQRTQNGGQQAKEGHSMEGTDDEQKVAHDARPHRNPFIGSGWEELHAATNQRAGIRRETARVQRASDSYWIYEFLRQSMLEDRIFEALVIGTDRPSYETDWRVVLLEPGVELPFNSLCATEGSNGGTARRVEVGMTLFLRVEACVPRARTLTLASVETPRPALTPPPPRWEIDEMGFQFR